MISVRKYDRIVVASTKQCEWCGGWSVASCGVCWRNFCADHGTAERAVPQTFERHTWAPPVPSDLNRAASWDRCNQCGTEATGVRREDELRRAIQRFLDERAPRVASVDVSVHSGSDPIAGWVLGSISFASHSDSSGSTSAPQALLVCEDGSLVCARRLDGKRRRKRDLYIDASPITPSVALFAVPDLSKLVRSV